MKRKNKLIMLLAILLLSFGGIAGIAHAFAQYHGNWWSQPVWGQHWWYNNHWSQNLVWYADDWWTEDHLNAMIRDHASFGLEYQLENEAYNPGQNTSCDRLDVTGVYFENLPVTGWSISNGCGNSAYKEEVKVQLDEYHVQPNTRLRHKVTYKKRNVGSGGNGEVNYSFSFQTSWQDSWLGKIEYNNMFDLIGSDPPELASN